MRKLATLCLVLAIALQSAVTRAQHYALVNLNSSNQYSQTAANGINSQGHITGYGVVAKTGEAHAFLYINGVFKDLGLLGYTFTDGIRINDRDQIAIDGNAPGADVLLYSNGTANSIGGADGGFTYALGMNNLGDIVGYGRSGDNTNVGFAYISGVFLDLSTVNPNIFRATAINDAQEVVGSAGYNPSVYTYAYHAFLYSGGVYTDLGSLTGSPNTFTQAFGINNAGDIVGYSTGTDGLFHAFLYNHGAMQDLGTFNGTNTVALAINNAGQVIGEQIDSLGISASAPSFLYQNGVMRDLSTLITSGGAGWSGLTVTGINDSGEIVGNGTYNGVTQGFLLVPGGVPSPILTSLSPLSTNAGGPGFPLKVIGNNFVSTSTVNWNGHPLATAYVSATQLTAAVPATLIANPGNAKVTVTNPGPGGGITAAKSISIVTTTLAPVSAQTVKNGDGSYTVTLSLQNTGYKTASSTQITSSALGASVTTSALPVSVGGISAGTTAGVKLNYAASAGTSGKAVALKVSGKFLGGTFTGSLKVTLP